MHPCGALPRPETATAAAATRCTLPGLCPRLLPAGTAAVYTYTLTTPQSLASSTTYSLIFPGAAFSSGQSIYWT